MPHSPAAVANENDEEGAKESSLESLESELSALQNTDDELLTNEEFAAKMEKEQELEQEEEEELESWLEEGGVGVWDDEYVDDAAGDVLGGVMDADELKEELKEVNQEIAGAFFF
jgi:alpha-amylase/alpha-mannosidase (GH57 family)